MKNSIISKFKAVVLLSIIVLAASSCNRGTGCPNNFSVKSAAKVISLLKR